MNTLNYSDGTTLWIKNILDKNLIVNKVVISEYLYGKIPTLEIDLQTDTQIVELTEEVSGYLIDPIGNKQVFTGYVYDVKYQNTGMHIGVILADKSFLRDVYNTHYTGLISAIQSTYKGNILSSLNYEDPCNGINVYQKNETNYKFCTRCSYGFRYNCLFGYSIEGLKFIDLNQWEAVANVYPSDDFSFSSFVNFSNPKLYSVETEEVNYSIGDDPYHTNVSYFNRIIPVDNDYLTITNNYLHNTRFSQSKVSVNSTSRRLWPYKLGDGLLVKESKLKLHKTFVSSRIIELTNSDINVTYTLQSIEL